MRSDTIDLTGRTYNRLTVLKYIGSSTWLCKCSCGNTCQARSYAIRKNIVVSCGCYKAEKAKEFHTTHGHSSKRTPTYQVWDGVIQRCTNKKNQAYKNYGGRGIRVSGKWLKFENFLKDMGEKPTTKHSIERIDNNGGYESQNCKWILLSKQHINKRTNFMITYKQIAMPLSEWAKKYNIHPSTLRNRIVRSRWPIDKSLTLPLIK